MSSLRGAEHREDAASGAWAGAGTNGGINFAIIDNSCGISPGLFVGEIIDSYAGISTIGFIMPTRFGSDTADVADRGRSWADRFVANPGGAAAPAWADALNSTTGGSNCAFGGGGHGIVGCGANIAISIDTTQARAQFSTLTESWPDSAKSATTRPASAGGGASGPATTTATLTHSRFRARTARWRAAWARTRRS